MLPPVLANIKPAYPHLVSYSKPNNVPDQQEVRTYPPVESEPIGDEPAREINIALISEWANEIRDAAAGMNTEQPE